MRSKMFLKHKEIFVQDMKRTLSSFSSGVGTVVSSVGSLSAAVSTTVLNLAYADEDLEDFGDSQFASDLRFNIINY